MITLAPWAFVGFEVTAFDAAYIAKPVDVQKMLATLRSVLDQRLEWQQTDKYDSKMRGHI